MAHLKHNDYITSDDIKVVMKLLKYTVPCCVDARAMERFGTLPIYFYRYKLTKFKACQQHMLLDYLKDRDVAILHSL